VQLIAEDGAVAKTGVRTRFTRPAQGLQAPSGSIVRPASASAGEPDRGPPRSV
jgi:hypothetical protein